MSGEANESITSYEENDVLLTTKPASAPSKKLRGQTIEAGVLTMKPTNTSASSSGNDLEMKVCGRTILTKTASKKMTPEKQAASGGCTSGFES
jgi:hypothetical protein